ncbi:hypothetical protein ACFOGJ_08750 [Marinibaculum pumilum]|uniref:Uncharacterized protein n=1 Tax=Marinibaculum pumilum TaxID=1766165 RepID=A0ABV7KYB8_9PROT
MMRRTIYWICIIGAVLWTLLSLASCMMMTGTVGETAGDQDVKTAVAGLGMGMHFIIWAVVVVPLGIFGILFRPSDKVIIQVSDRQK